MFKRMPGDRATYLTSAGEIELQAMPKHATEQKHTKYVIAYKAHFDDFPLSLFQFNLRESNQLFIADNLVMSPSFANSPMASEQTYHFFLGWVLRKMPHWAKEHGKRVVAVTTELLHCTEWFVHFNYSLLKQEGSKYRGSKTVNRR